MNRHCVCGKQISIKRQLCNECLEIYGEDPKDWPEWLRWQVSDIQRELDYERRHGNDLPFYEDIINIGYKPFKLNGCRTETHLYEDREKY